MLPSPSGPCYLHGVASASPTAPGRESQLTLLAALPCLLAGLLQASRSGGVAPGLDLLAGLGRVTPLVVCSVSVAVLVSWLSARLLERPPIPGAAVCGLLFSLTLPADAPVVAAGASIAFGLFVGREIFGRAERSFAHPAVLAYVFCSLTWPQALVSSASWQMLDTPMSDWTRWMILRPPGGALGASSAIAIALGGVILLAARRRSWRTVAAGPIGMAAAIGLLGHASSVSPVSLDVHLMLGSALFGLVFLATDLHASPTSASGRWFHGFLVGFVIVLIRLANPKSPDGTMAALLVASVFAPLLDRAAAWRVAR